MNAQIKPGRTADVVISGLGPTGLVLAHILGRGGRRVIVLEREPQFYGNARAVYTDDECMRIFQSIGMAEALQSRMLLETPVQLARPDGTVMSQYLPLKRPLGWPVVNFFYQPYLETSLTEALTNYPSVEIMRGRELVEFQQDKDGVNVVHRATQSFRFRDDCDARSERAGDADVQTLRCRYLVGADGGRSTVRTQLKIEMSGRNFPEPWLVVDLKLKEGRSALRHIPYFSFIVDPEMPAVSCVQPDGHHRFEFMLMKGTTKEEMERPETVHRLLSRFVDPEHFDIKRKLVYTFNALVANRWREGRVLLAGDAAHMTPQFMGQGASSGFRDAYSLGWRLNMVLAGTADDTLLNSYESERRDHAKAMIDISVLLKDIVSMTNPLKCGLRDLSLKLIMMVPFTRRFFQEGGFKPQPVYTQGQYLGIPRRHRSAPEGRMLPQPEVRSIEGRRLLLDEVLGPGFSLLGIGVDPKQILPEVALNFLADINTRYVTLYPYAARPQGIQGVDRCGAPDVAEVEDFSGELIAWFRKAGHRTGSVAILRPDRFVFAVVPMAELERVVDELRARMGWVPQPLQLSQAA